MILFDNVSPGLNLIIYCCNHFSSTFFRYFGRSNSYSFKLIQKKEFYHNLINHLFSTSGNGSVRGQGSVVSTNAYEDTSTRRDGTSEHAYKSLHLDHEQSHYYSRIPEKSGTPGVRTTQEEVTPSAPPIEGHDQNTEAQEGHEYFVLEREPSKRSSETENSNHDYFVLEKDQGEGGEDGDTPGKEVDSAIVSKPAATHEGYDRIKLSPQHNTAENTYSHLKPNPVKEVEYDHLARPGHT